MSKRKSTRKTVARGLPVLGLTGLLVACGAGEDASQDGRQAGVGGKARPDIGHLPLTASAVMCELLALNTTRACDAFASTQRTSARDCSVTSSKPTQSWPANPGFGFGRSGETSRRDRARRLELGAIDRLLLQ